MRLIIYNILIFLFTSSCTHEVQSNQIKLCDVDPEVGLIRPHLVIDFDNQMFSSFDMTTPMEDCGFENVTCYRGSLIFIEPGHEINSINSEKIDAHYIDNKDTNDYVFIGETTPEFSREFHYNFDEDGEVIYLQIVQRGPRLDSSALYERC